MGADTEICAVVERGDERWIKLCIFPGRAIVNGWQNVDDLGLNK